MGKGSAPWHARDYSCILVLIPHSGLRYLRFPALCPLANSLVVSALPSDIEICMIHLALIIPAGGHDSYVCVAFQRLEQVAEAVICVSSCFLEPSTSAVLSSLVEFFPQSILMMVR